jgi:hypothetical protein
VSGALPPDEPPIVERPDVPAYGIPRTLEGALPWSWAEARLAGAETYWVATTRPDGRPHTMPIWAAWCAGRLWFEGGRLTRRARNLEANPAISVGIELPGDGAVVVEGTVERFAGPPDGLTGPLVAAFAKYATAPRGYIVDPANWSSPDGGIWAVTPGIVFGWSSFPADATRWRFAASAGPPPDR